MEKKTSTELEPVVTDTPVRSEISVYVDGQDFLREIGAARGGNTVYPSLANLLENDPMARNSGVIKAKLVFEEWVIAPNSELRAEKSSERLKHLRELKATHEAAIEKLAEAIRSEEKPKGRRKKKAV